MNTLKKIFLNGINIDIIKTFAILTMVIDHIGHILYPETMWLRVVGRTTFPIFAFLIAFHLSKKNLLKKYLKRLLPFALLSTILISPFEAIIQDYFRFNILWSFIVALLPLFIFEKVKKETIPTYLKILILTISFFICGILSYLCDYKIHGFLLIIFLYFYFKTNKKIFLFASLIDGALINSKYLFSYPDVVITYMSVTFLTVLFLLIIKKYIPEKQKRFLKPWWLFYVFYPLHILVLYLIKITWF